jgi:hypothetical protein
MPSSRFVADAGRCARLGSWSTALLRRQTTPAVAARAVVGTDTEHVAEASPGAPPLDLHLWWQRLTEDGIDGLWVALVSPGDPIGLPGPARFNEAAVDRGGAVIAHGAPVAWLPETEVRGPVGDQLVLVTWRAYAVDRDSAAMVEGQSLGDAERDLRQALLDAATDLTELDVARWSDDAGLLLDDLRAGVGPDLPPGAPARARAVAALAERLLLVLDLAVRDDGSAVSATQAAQRLTALSPLERAARRAKAAAYNAVLSPSRLT